MFYYIFLFLSVPGPVLETIISEIAQKAIFGQLGTMMELSSDTLLGQMIPTSLPHLFPPARTVESDGKTLVCTLKILNKKLLNKK